MNDVDRSAISAGEGDFAVGTVAAATLLELKRAQDEPVSALVADRRDPPEQCKRARSTVPSGLKATFANDLLATDSAVLIAIDVAKSPVEVGLKHSIKQLGKLIHAEVGDGGMLDVAERVCALDDNQWQRRMSPIDSAWNGIGSWYS